MGRTDDPQWREQEHALCLRAKAGDQRAFAELYDAFAKDLLNRVLMPRLKNIAQAEDVLSDSFHTAREELHRFQPTRDGPSFWFWLKQIASNRTNDLHREAGRAGRAMRGFLVFVRSVDAEGIEREVDHPKLAAKVQKIFALMNPRYASVLHMLYFEELSREEIAERLGINALAFNMLFVRADAQFKKLWQEHDDGH